MRETSRLPLSGRIIASPEVSVTQIVRAVGEERKPLALVSANETGWFSGMTMVCADPVEELCGCDIDQVATILQSTMRSAEPMVASAVLPYDGDARVRIYRSGVVLAEEGWMAWGEPDFEFSPDTGAAPVLPPETAPLLSRFSLDFRMRDYLERVEAVREAIRAGDVYVLNLTMRVKGNAPADPVRAFETLLNSSAGPMSALWIDRDRSIVSVSPERFLSVEDDGGIRRAQIWPIKGTRPRGPDPVTDARLARELADSEKERAEHLMIVDLERNDLGRVCETGSVSVASLFEVFQTPYCHQLVSKVTGRMRPELPLAKLLESTFPCGSVTGAPKIAAMRLIRELEVSPRGAYTGSLLVAMGGRLDSSVLIRTLEYRGDEAYWGTGGGVTIDSVPAEEWREALLKARPVLGDARIG